MGDYWGWKLAWLAVTASPLLARWVQRRRVASPSSVPHKSTDVNEQSPIATDVCAGHSRDRSYRCRSRVRVKGTHNPSVAGSIPAGPTTRRETGRVDERLLGDVDDEI